ncbi:shikimate dehydrogenase [Salinibacterium sp. dk2585]|uniref:shikimate dehydrogenase n=1 Tax=unclassified Salinibacterium TaxID=2632331 RepID=UPI0011C24525|nr:MULTISPECIES: shikimate dehydrogenase [unclassified Salinibacterium]QEE61283.1 shikimate dehydrogenase [Salinibacterium sp. dk2585]TXK53959.1 shikimate dehydrogenase [Salinibacterium sp. dk5596]
MTDDRRLAVLGSPIAHSLSPLLHTAAYEHLGLSWRYDRIEMTGAGLQDFLSGLGPEWRGLSLTMPVKHDVIPLLDERHPLVELTGACNTALLEEGRLTGFNTDVHGVVMAFREAGVQGLEHVHVLGGGATAASAIAAASMLGATRVTVAVRTPSRALHLAELAASLHLQLDVHALADGAPGSPDAVISTLPNGTVFDNDSNGFSEQLRRSAVLFDVAYDPWPSALAASWSAAGGRVISGFEMLLHQAVMQVRIFAGTGAEVPLPDEDTIVEIMRASVARAV